MTTRLQPYPEYKDSGLPWFARIPAHWQEKRAKYLFREVDERSTTGGEELLSVSHLTGVTPRSQKSVTMFMAESYVGHKLCRPGDLVVNTMWAWMSALGVAKQSGIVSPAYAVYRPIDPDVLLSDFVDHLLRTEPYRSEYIRRSTGIRSSRLRLYPEKFLEIPIACPPRQEQREIVAYVRAKDWRIRRLIRAKRRLIELLNEQKQVIIHSAVTRGLDPSVRLKPSGIDWLGDVPEHWQVVALRWLATKFGSGITPRGGATVYQELGVPFLRSQNVHFDGLRLAGVARIARDLHESLFGTHVRPGDVLLNITGASIGRACSVPEQFTEGNVNQHVCILRPRANRVLPEFLAAFLSTPFMQREIRFEQNGASREGLTLGSIRGFKILLPTVQEQTAILRSVQEECREVALTAENAARQVSLLREYRTRLISDVVTGKLDVRGVELPPLDEAEELDGLDLDEDATAEEDEAVDSDAPE